MSQNSAFIPADLGPLKFVLVVSSREVGDGITFSSLSRVPWRRKWNPPKAFGSHALTHPQQHACPSHTKAHWTETLTKIPIDRGVWAAGTLAPRRKLIGLLGMANAQYQNPRTRTPESVPSKILPKHLWLYVYNSCHLYLYIICCACLYIMYCMY